MVMIPIDYKRNENFQSIKELWESMALFCTNRVEDNTRYHGKYPVQLRANQMKTLESLVNEIKAIHNEALTNKEK